MENGVIAGYPLRDIKVTVIDGSYHEVDSNEMAFKIAASMGFSDACKKADAVLLEPIMKVEVLVPQEFMGDVIGNLNGRRGKVQGMKVRAGAQAIEASVPLMEMFGYATDLRSARKAAPHTVWNSIDTNRCLNRFQKPSLPSTVASNG